jgi:2-dehydropantoate 2-reductase
MERMEDTSYISRESFALFPNDILADARKRGVSLQRLTEMEPHFSSSLLAKPGYWDETKEQ